MPLYGAESTYGVTTARERLYSDTSTSLTLSSSHIWVVWNQSHTATSSGGSTVSLSCNTTGTASALWTHWVQHQNLTREQQQAQVVRQEQYRQSQLVAEGERARARERAQTILQEHLDDRQKAELAASGHFHLDLLSRSGERKRYRIKRQWSHSIEQIDPENGRRIKTLCIHPREQVPVEDSMLAQKLMLEGGMEEELLRIANHS